MAKIDVNTDAEVMTAQIQERVENLQSYLWSCRISSEALEQKLAKYKFSDAEKTCIRYAFRAVNVDGYEAADSLMSEWGNVFDDEIAPALDAELANAESTGDFRQVIRLGELETMADSCIEAAWVCCED